MNVKLDWNIKEVLVLKGEELTHNEMFFKLKNLDIE